MNFSGITLHLYTTQEEIINGKKGVNTILAWIKAEKPLDANYHISVPIDVCDILEKEVRVNTGLIKQYYENMSNEMGKAVGNAMSQELEKVFSKF